MSNILPSDVPPERPSDASREHIKPNAVKACPDCGNSFWIEGPSGGLSINMLCGLCFAEFNDMGPFGLDRIERSPKERDAIYAHKLQASLKLLEDMRQKRTAA